MFVDDRCPVCHRRGVPTEFEDVMLCLEKGCQVVDYRVVRLPGGAMGPQSREALFP